MTFAEQSNVCRTPVERPSNRSGIEIEQKSSRISRNLWGAAAPPVRT